MSSACRRVSLALALLPQALVARHGAGMANAKPAGAEGAGRALSRGQPATADAAAPAPERQYRRAAEVGFWQVAYSVTSASGAGVPEGVTATTVQAKVSR